MTYTKRYYRAPTARQEPDIDLDSTCYDKVFLEAVFKVLEEEGGYVNDKKDPGGETKFGISKRSYPQLDIKNLTKTRAIEIYYLDFWLRSKCDKLPPEIRNKFFSLSVNTGGKTANILLQRALRSYGFKTLTDDGVIGPITLNALKEINGYDKGVMLLTALKSEAAGYYRLLGTNKDMNKFLKGWLNRAYS